MAKNPKTYVAPHDVYQGGILHKAGEPFTTADPKGKDWEPADPVAKAANIAADPLAHDDVNLDALGVTELRAHAASIGINLGEAKSKDDIITVIKAANQPAL
jgi:hypothetical protein